MNADRIQLLEQYIQEEPENPFNRYALAMEYHDEAPNKALGLLEDLLQDHPDYLPTYFKAAHLLWEFERWEPADEIFQKGIALAKARQDQKALGELGSSYQNFLFERD